MTAPQNLAEIGTTPESMVLVNSLAGGDMPAPKMQYFNFESYKMTAANRPRGFGRPNAEWRFFHLKPEWIDALRAYCPEGQAAAEIYIKTRVNVELDEYRVLKGWMVWDPKERIDEIRRELFLLTFTDLEEVVIDGS